MQVGMLLLLLMVSASNLTAGSLEDPFLRYCKDERGACVWEMAGLQYTNVDNVCSVLSRRLKTLPKHIFLIWLCNEDVRLSDLHEIVSCVVGQGWMNIDVELMIPGKPAAVWRRVRFAVIGLDATAVLDNQGQEHPRERASGGKSPHSANEMTR